VTTKACFMARPPSPSPNHQIPNAQAWDPTIAGLTLAGEQKPDPQGELNRANHSFSGARAQRRGPQRSRLGGNPADLVEHTGKVMRIASMIKELLEEVRAGPWTRPPRRDPPPLEHKLEQGRAPELIEALERIALIRRRGALGRRATLRAGPNRRLARRPFDGIQVALLAQQMVSQQKLQTMRRALPPGQPGQDGGPGQHRGPATQNGQDPRDGGSTKAVPLTPDGAVRGTGSGRAPTEICCPF
jgi:hypothetical protein